MAVEFSVGCGKDKIIKWHSNHRNSAADKMAIKIQHHQACDVKCTKNMVKPLRLQPQPPGQGFVPLKYGTLNLVNFSVNLAMLLVTTGYYN